MKGIRRLLLLRTSPTPEGLLYVAEKGRNQPNRDPKMDHLVCFLPGKDSACKGHWGQSGGRVVGGRRCRWVCNTVDRISEKGGEGLFNTYLPIC